MRDEAVDALLHPRLPLRPVFVDATVGGGGHARALLTKAPAGAVLLGLDRDAAAVHAAERWADSRCKVVHGSYVDVRKHLAASCMPPSVHGLLADLGLSSHQLDSPARGFTFREDGPLDMRFDVSSRITAGDLVRSLPLSELSRILSTYGEEPQAHAIATAIVAARAQSPVVSTQQLAQVVSSAAAAGARRRGWAPSLEGGGPGAQAVVRVFQALRIAANDELSAVHALLDAAPGLVDTQDGGTLAVITFHSLEDRLVKRAFRRLVTPVAPPRGGAGRWAYVHPGGLLLPSRDEVEQNRRARSAKLRAVRWLPGA